MARTILVYAVLASLPLAACARRDDRRVTPEPPAVATMDASAYIQAPPPTSAAVTTISPRPSDLAWVTSLPRAKGFTTHDVRDDAGDTPLVLHWRFLSERRRLELKAAHRTIALGDHSGSPESSELTHCRTLGFRQPPGERWSFPDLPSVVASFSVATMQGSADWLVLDGGGGRLHVLGRHTHDGACPSSVMQGPLDVCVDMKWQRRFDLLVGDVHRVRERVTIGEDGGDTDFDCKSSYSGQGLLPPHP